MPHTGGIAIGSIPFLHHPADTRREILQPPVNNIQIHSVSQGAVILHLPEMIVDFHNRPKYPVIFPAHRPGILPADKHIHHNRIFHPLFLLPGIRRAQSLPQRGIRASFSQSRFTSVSVIFTPIRAFSCAYPLKPGLFNATSILRICDLSHSLNCENTPKIQKLRFL